MQTSRMLVALSTLFLSAFATPARADDVTPDPKSIVVHVVDAPGALLARNGKIVCEAPCAVAVPRDGAYRVDAREGTSQRFALPDAGTHATIHVEHAQKSNALAGGIVLASTLSVSALFGVVAYAVANGPPCSAAICIGGNGSGAAEMFGMFAGVTGVVGLGVGAILLATKSTVTKAHVSAKRMTITPGGFAGTF